MKIWWWSLNNGRGVRLHCLRSIGRDYAAGDDNTNFNNTYIEFTTVEQFFLKRESPMSINLKTWTEISALPTGFQKLCLASYAERALRANQMVLVFWQKLTERNAVNIYKLENCQKHRKGLAGSHSTLISNLSASACFCVSETFDGGRDLLPL